MKQIITLILLAMFCLHAKANTENTKGKIKGTVIDQTTKEPLAYSTIRLFTIKDSILVKGCITNNDGEFELDGIKWGTYNVRIDFIGYQTREIEIDLSLKQRLNKLQIELEAESKGLGEVQITAEKKLMQTSVQKNTYNVDKNITLEGGSGLDAMQSIPSVMVDIDGKISYRGSENVMVLINGEQSVLTGKGNGSGLEQLSSDMIEKIEVISNPSAKYDAEGMSGIINVILKKNKKAGRNTGFNVSAGLDEILNASLSHSRSNKKLSFGITTGIKHKDFFQTKEHFRNNFGDPGALNYYNFDDMQMNKNIGSLTTSLGVKTSKKSKLNLNALLNKEWTSADRHIDYEELQKSGDVFNTFFKDIESDIDGYDYSFSSNFTQKLKKGRSIKLYSSASHADKVSKMKNSRYQSKNDDSPELQNTRSDYKNSIYNYGLDYKHTIDKVRTLDFGYKGSYQKVENDFNATNYDAEANLWLIDNTLSNLFDYKEVIQAAYINYTGKLGSLDLNTGLRVEYSKINVNSTNKDEYTNLFPVFTLSKKLGKYTVFSSFNRRINRPKLKMLNPYSDEYSDDWNTHRGNPFLKHELINSYELGWKYNTAGLHLSTSLYYRDIKDAICRIKSATSDNSSITSYLNMDDASLLGGELTGSIKVNKRLDITAGANLFQTKLKALFENNKVDKDLFAWNAKMNAALKLPYQMKFQVSAFMRSKMPTVLETIKANHYIDVALSKKVMKGKGMLSFKISDLFDTNSYQPIVEGINANQFAYKQTNERKIESRFFVLNLKYNIASGTKKKKAQKGKFFWDNLTK